MSQKAAGIIQENTSQANLGVQRKPETLADSKARESHPLANISLGNGDSAAQYASVIQRSSLFQPVNETQKARSFIGLQQQYGNRFVQRVISHNAIQAKLRVGAPGDIYEQEADEIAKTVTKTSDSRLQRKPIINSITPLFQRQEEEEDKEEVAQRKPLEEDKEEIVQPKAQAVATQVSPTTSPIIQLTGPGEPMSLSTRSTLEPWIGADLSGVRVHTDTKAHEASRALRARAFTHGSHIWLGAGESQSNLSLMAHETTHVIQQGAAIQRLPDNGGEGSAPATSPASASGPSPAGSAPPSPPASGGSGPASQQASGTASGGGTSTVESVAPGGEAAASAGGMESGTDVDLLMPEPPSELSEDAQSRLEEAQSNASQAATTEAELPSAESDVGEARGAVEEPEEETAGRAENALVEALGARPEPSPEIEELCQRIYEVIRNKRPPDEESLVDADPEEMAQQAGGQLNSSIEGDTQRVSGSYDEMNNPPEGTPQQQAEEMEATPQTVETPGIGAENAAPDEVPPENVSLDNDVAASEARMEEAGMNSEPAQLVESGPIAEAREAQGELSEMAQQDPAEVLAQQQETLSQTRADMASLQEAALEALQASRSSTVEGSQTQQVDMVGSEEQMRAEASRRAQTVFTDAQNRVNTLLEPLPRTAMSRWEAGVAILSSQFRQHLSRVKAWVDERHSGVGGAILGAVDYLTGLPGWVTEEYDDAERTFGDGVCDLIREISVEVNGVVAACEAIIEDANREIGEIFSSLPDNLQEWATQQQQGFSERLDTLHNQVTETRDNFNRDLSNRAAQSVQEVREEIHQLRQEAGGLVGRIVDAVNRFLDDPAKFIIEGLLSLLGIPPAAFWAVVARIQQVISDIADDPMNFANNLMNAIGKGFSQFFDNITTHLLNGLLEWLFSGMGAVGVQIPSDFSLKSIITFFLQLMGITWPRIRQILARHIGEQNVALIEKAYEIISILIEKGPQGIFDLIKDRLNPQDILDQVLNAAVEFLIEALITRVTARIIAMFNPAGAILTAIEAIYRVLRWIFENAARIFRLVETVVNGIADIIAGNIGGMANAVENALAGLIAPVIDFLAGFLGLGDLPDKIKGVIQRMQNWVEGILDRVIGWLAERAKSLLRSLGIGGEEEEAAPGEYDGQIGKVVTWTAEGESHRMWIVMEGNNATVMMASAGGTNIIDALSIYEQKANGLQEEDPDTSSEVLGLIQQARELATALDSESDQLAGHVNSENADPDQVKNEDNKIEADEESLRGVISQIQTKLGLNDEQDIQRARAEFGNRLFSSSQELAPLLGISGRTAQRRTSKWVGDGILFRLASASSDPAGMYSFDPVKANQRETSPNNRSKYGYSNPAKTSGPGLQVLSKGLRQDSPQPILAGSADYHRNLARYFSTRPGSGYRNFGFGDAILGHKEDMGASQHWNRIGHTQSKAENIAWNKDPNNYQGPEHRTESSASGAGSERYKIPSKLDGSHPDWW